MERHAHAQAALDGPNGPGGVALRAALVCADPAGVGYVRRRTLCDMLLDTIGVDITLHEATTIARALNRASGQVPHSVSRAGKPEGHAVTGLASSDCNVPTLPFMQALGMTV